MDDYAVDPVLRNDRSILIRCCIDSDGVNRIELIPVLIANFQVNLATGEEFDAIGSRLKLLSARVRHANLSQADGILEVDLSSK